MYAFTACPSFLQSALMDPLIHAQPTRWIRTTVLERQPGDQPTPFWLRLDTLSALRGSDILGARQTLKRHRHFDREQAFDRIDPIDLVSMVNQFGSEQGQLPTKRIECSKDTPIGSLQNIAHE